MRVAVFVTPLNDAETVTTVDVDTAVVVIVNRALVEPAATVTLVGVCATALLSETVTTAPPAGAGPLKVTVPVEDLPPTTAVGLKVKELSTGGFTVSVAVCVTPLYLAVIVTVVLVATALVVIVNVAVLKPAATVTLAGT